MKKTHFVICVDNSEYPTSLEKRKIYETVADADASKHGHIRVIDESGDDYLYPTECFVEANLLEDTKEAVVRAAEQCAALANWLPSRFLHPQELRR